MFDKEIVNAAAIQCVAQIAEDDTVSEKVMDVRLAALRELKQRAHYYFGEGFMGKMCADFLRDKVQFLLQAATKGEIKEILALPRPKNNGSKIVAGSKYDSIAEELFIWSQTSLTAPLSSDGVDRMMELMKQYFGDEVYEKIMCKKERQEDK